MIANISLKVTELIALHILPSVLKKIVLLLFCIQFLKLFRVKFVPHNWLLNSISATKFRSIRQLSESVKIL
jgi:hypothetical protein